jgi:hypothetical protein
MFVKGMKVIINNPDDDIKNLKNKIARIDSITDEDIFVYIDDKYDSLYVEPYEISILDLENE